jgi:hypothetical protein
MLLASILLGAAVLGQAPSVADLELTDQNGASDSLAAHRDHVVLVMVVTAKRLRNLKAWEKELREPYEGIHYLRIADVPEAPPVTHEQVARKLAARVPEGVPILIDLERRWSREMELDTGRPNLLLFDRHGRLSAAFRGRMEPALLDEVRAALDRLVEPR